MIDREFYTYNLHKRKIRKIIFYGFYMIAKNNIKWVEDKLDIVHNTIIKKINNNIPFKEALFTTVDELVPYKYKDEVISELTKRGIL